MVQYNHNSNFMRIYTNGSEAMRIDSSGRLGIGTTSPAQLLHLQGADAGLILDDTDGTSTHQQTWLKSDNGNFRLQTRNSSNTFVSNDYLVQKGASGATSHQWRIDNSEAMRIDSSGNVGIGTTSPSTTLDLTSSTNGHGLKIRQGNAGSGYHSAINFEGSNGSGGYVAVASIKAYQETNGVNGSLRFYTDTTGTERMRIDSSGNVGIGTTAPSGNLDITTSGLVSLDIQGGDGNSKNIIFRKTTGGIQQAKISAVGDDLRFTTGTTSERMRIDSNGNLLVGTTDQVAHVGSSTGEGIALSAGSYGGFIGASRSDNVVTVLNRQTSDGNIVQFRKDGNTVGSIGVDNTDNLVIEGNSTHSGLQFGTNALLPHKSGVVVDNTLTLGSTTARWANMYLAGGVYLGGTATANRLDDYEEGTWTPQAGRLTGGTISATYSVQEGTYTKIGNLVYVTCYVVIDSITSQGSSYTTIEGLPFTSSGSNYTHLLSSSGNAINTTDVITQGFPSGTRMLFGYDRNTNFPPIANDWQAGLIRISGCYRA
jgi:hypothetical protein